MSVNIELSYFSINGGGTILIKFYLKELKFKICFTLILNYEEEGLLTSYPLSLCVTGYPINISDQLTNQNFCV